MVLLLYLWENVRKWSSFEHFDTFDQLEKGGHGGGLDVVVSGASCCRDNEHGISGDGDTTTLVGMDTSGLTNNVVSISILQHEKEEESMSLNLNEGGDGGYQQVCCGLVVRTNVFGSIASRLELFFAFSPSFSIFSCLFPLWARNDNPSRTFPLSAECCERHSQSPRPRAAPYFSKLEQQIFLKW